MAEKAQQKFGTFAGVFTPSILTILSAILFLRANFVVGEAGLLGALGILGIANLIALCSAVSVCAVATNMQVRGGGAYFLISRVLGPAFGGSIGLVFYIAMALNVAFNVIGFTDALTITFPAAHGAYLWILIGIAVLLFAIAFVGAGLAIKAQFIIMGCVILSLVATFGGLALRFDSATLAANIGPGYTALATGAGSYNIWIVFAIFFPAATGFLSGVNMSGDLKEPSKSIPAGTLAAVFSGVLIYGVAMLLGAAALPRAELISRPFEALQDNALFGAGFLVTLGIFAATLSTALASYLGAPRVLQAVSRDRLIPLLAPFTKGAGRADEPRRALWLTFTIALGVLVWAGLNPGGNAFNAVASLMSMVFLFTYGMLNLAAFVEGFGHNPSFRPQFRLFHWGIPLLGFLGCVFVALKIDPLAAVIAAVFIVLVFWYLAHRELNVHFGDAWYGFAFSQARNWLLRLAESKSDARNWRPVVMGFIDRQQTSVELISYAAWLEAGRGLMQVVNVVQGDPLTATDAHLRAQAQLKRLLAEHGVRGFAVAVVAEDNATGFASTLQTAAIGPVQPNLALFDFADDLGKPGDQLACLRTAERLGISSVLLHSNELPQPGSGKQIDVWWRGRKNGALMLLLAWLLSTNWEWAGAEIRLMRVIGDEQGRESTTTALMELLSRARIKATVKVFVSDKPFRQIFHDISAGSDCVFLGYEIPDEAGLSAWLASYRGLQADQPTTLMVNAAGLDEILQ